MSFSCTALLGLGASILAGVVAERIISNNEIKIDKYKRNADNMSRKGLNKYVSMSRVNNKINKMEKIKKSDPKAARKISYDIESEMRHLEDIALENQRKYEEMLKKDSRKKELLDYYFNAIRKIEDPILFDFAKNEIEKLRDNVLNDFNLSNDINIYYRRIDNGIADIIKNIEKDANEWKIKREKEKEKRILKTQIDDVEEELKNGNIELKENIEKRNKFLEQIENAKKSLSSNNVNIEEINKSIENISDETDKMVITEDERKLKVKSILKTLKSHDFTVEAPELIKDDNGGIVKIVAKKPSGKRAVCKITLDNKLEYTFDNYEGKTCLDDMNKFEGDLEKVYSMKFSDKKILWENPDRISKNAIDINNSDKRTL
ncbi:hypothetical protein [Brachyspira hampsonii]|uniref:hypothetical protein n=1 Tax=Brachyspira hampsonii TaxID=1287055 RepID=UPI000D39FE33|nr:hypothetical protein [Brachyspira hampsonii]PTY39401.1 hypothetical protein DQ06_01855 [Brachyspira hampsonii bv. II]